MIARLAHFDQVARHRSATAQARIPVCQRRIIGDSYNRINGQFITETPDAFSEPTAEQANFPNRQTRLPWKTPVLRTDIQLVEYVVEFYEMRGGTRRHPQSLLFEEAFQSQIRCGGRLEAHRVDMRPHRERGSPSSPEVRLAGLDPLERDMGCGDVGRRAHSIVLHPAARACNAPPRPGVERVARGADGPPRSVRRSHVTPPWCRAHSPRNGRSGSGPPRPPRSTPCAGAGYGRRPCAARHRRRGPRPGPGAARARRRGRDAA